MVMDWKSSVPVWPDSYLPENKPLNNPDEIIDEIIDLQSDDETKIIQRLMESNSKESRVASPAYISPEQTRHSLHCAVLSSPEPKSAHKSGSTYYNEASPATILFMPSTSNTGAQDDQAEPFQTTRRLSSHRSMQSAQGSTGEDLLTSHVT